MSKKVQLKNINTGDSIHPITSVDFVENFEEKFKELNQGDEQRLQDLEKREDKDTIYDDTEIRNEITNIKNSLKNIGGSGNGDGSYDDTELRGRIETLEQKEDKDTVYDDTEIQGQISLLKEIMDGKVNVEVCDSQFDFDAILTKSNNTIYLIKGDQDVWAAKDYVDELFELIADLRSRVTKLESDTYDIPNEEEPSVE